MKKIILILTLILLTSCTPINNDILYQTSTIDALLDEVYDGDITVRQLKQKGDFGLGTYNNLDGEMLALDGIYYQIKSDGIAYIAKNNQKSPFAAVTFFEPDKTININANINFTQLTKYIDTKLPTNNIFYAIKITGDFKYIKARAPPKQEKPYIELAEAIKQQSIFEFNNTRGTIVALRSPDFVQGVNVPGYHLHFITDDKNKGGHVLALETDKITVEIDYTSDFFLNLPNNKEFYELGTEDKQEELEKVEK